MSLLLTLLSIQAPVALPEPPRKRFVDTVEVAEVVVHAVVTDRAGRPVLGLEATDFLVLEEGSRVDVMSAEYHPWIRSSIAASAVRDSPAALPVVGDGRRFIFLFHDLRRTDRETLGVASHQLRAGRDARNWVREALAPGDLAAVAAYDYRLKIHQDFTNDPAALERAIIRAVSREPEEEAAAAPGAPSLLAELPGFRERRRRSTRLGAALELLAEAVRPVAGPKSLLLFSVGVGLDGPGRSLLTPRGESSLIERLNDSELAVYCLDTTPPAVDHSLAGTLGVLAERSGGEYFGHIAQFRGPLRQIERRLHGYYVLTFLPSRAGAGYRRIEVTTSREELVVTARRGYLAP
jgi:VWFA-related protein